MKNSEKTISANSKGITISYRDSNKHLFVRYETPVYVKNIQVNGTVKYQKIVEENSFEFNPVQKNLYQKLIYGLPAYKPYELVNMTYAKKTEIIVKCNKANKLLNRWKQETINENIDSLLLKLFPKSSIVKQFVNTKGYDDSLKCFFTPQQLNITKNMIIDRFMKENLLPSNFYELT